MMEMVIVSALNTAAERAKDGALQNNPACPIVLRNARRVGELTHHSLAEIRVRDNSINGKLRRD